MNAKSYKTAEETEITGDLVNAIEKVFDNDNSEEWAKYYSVHDDPPICDEKERGKAAKDLILESIKTRPKRVSALRRND